MKLKIITLLSVFLFTISSSSIFAAPPKVPTESPYIVLSDNLDEPNGYGFCLDTMSRGQTDLMHVHSCKPKSSKNKARAAKNNDVRFSFDNANKRIESYAFQGQCMQVLIAGKVSVFGLLDCSKHPRQRFVYQIEDLTFRLEEDQSKCVVVSSKTEKAGPWVKRQLALSDCDKTDDTLKQWDVTLL